MHSLEIFGTSIVPTSTYDPLLPDITLARLRGKLQLKSSTPTVTDTYWVYYWNDRISIERHSRDDEQSYRNQGVLRLELTAEHARHKLSTHPLHASFTPPRHKNKHIQHTHEFLRDFRTESTGLHPPARIRINLTLQTTSIQSGGWRREKTLSTCA